MKKIVYVLVLAICTAIKVYSQATPLSPLNNTAVKRFIKNETSVMNWSIINYYIEKTTRKLFRQEIDFGGRKMVMELLE